jgi:alpha-L-rhamnosidase
LRKLLQSMIHKKEQLNRTKSQILSAAGVLIFLIILFGASLQTGWGAISASNLLCDLAANPLGLDEPKPRLSWQSAANPPGQRGQTQTAFQILAASSTNLLAGDHGDLWDSGKVVSDVSLNVAYAGRPLVSGQQVFWKMRVWDGGNHVSAWSPVATWTMGLLHSNDWKATWLSAPGHRLSLTGSSWIWFPEGDPSLAAPVATRYFRASIVVRPDSVLTNATLLLSADNSYVAYLNGTQVSRGNDFLNVTPVNATAQLRPGTNVLAVVAQNSGESPNPAGLIGRLILDYTDGRQTTFDTGVTWKTAGQPQPEWQSPGFDDSAWAAARVLGAYGTAPWMTQVNIQTQSALPIFRRDFVVRPGLQRAVIFICGLGQYELSVNGAKVGDDLLSPGWTKYDQTCLYDTYDLASSLNPGTNTLGVMLGNGMYNVVGGARYTKFTGSFGPPKFIAQLQLFYADGTSEVVVSDPHWLTSPGPITFSSIYGGEDYDARLNPAGWKKPGFDAGAWSPAQAVNGPGGKLAGLSWAAPPLRAFETLRPVQSHGLRPNVTVYDLGQNAALMLHLKVQGARGDVVRITPSELLHKDGSLDRRSSTDGRPVYWQYTLAGDGEEIWFPKFFYQGCRYLQAECIPAANHTAPPVIDDISGVVIGSASEPVGEFACSNELFNRIYTLIRWAQRANLVSVITDCPHRERLGWLEQYHLNGPSLRYNFNLAQLFTKGMNDMADSQLPDGLVPDIAPEYPVFGGPFRDSPEWGSAFVIVPWQQYEFDGDPELLRRYYTDMKRYVAYLGSKAQDNIVSYGLGDWYDIGPKPPGPSQLTPNSLTATAFYYYDTWILAQVAALLDKPEQVKRFTAQSDAIRTAFNKKFYNATNHSYATGSQCANAIPLVMNLCEPANRAAVLDAIVADVRQHGNAITAGDVGYRYLLKALAEGGRSDVIFDMNNQSEKPGYGYQLKMGATSLTEAWDANPTSSQNHFMLGQIMEWFYADLAGIASDPAGPGFKKIIIRPQPVGDVTWVKAAYDSVHGRIVCDWKKADDKFTLQLEIPANTTATVFVPAQNAGRVFESDRPAAQAMGVHFLREENGCAVFEVGPGSYQFVSK